MVRYALFVAPVVLSPAIHWSSASLSVVFLACSAADSSIAAFPITVGFLRTLRGMAGENSDSYGAQFERVFHPGSVHLSSVFPAKHTLLEMSFC
jgi:hypothetical protein